MAQAQETPLKKQESATWSARRLFPVAAITSSITKMFSTPFEALLALSVVSIAVAEILDNHVSWLFYVLTFMLLLLSFSERRNNVLKEPKA